MQKTPDIQIKRYKEVEAGISYFSLQGLLSVGQTLVLNPETRTVSLLSDGPMLIVEQQLSANEMHLFVPILESFPHYCPYEVSLTHISARTVTAASRGRCRQRLSGGTSLREMGTGVETHSSCALVVTQQVAPF